MRAWSATCASWTAASASIHCCLTMRIFSCRCMADSVEKSLELVVDMLCCCIWNICVKILGGT
jgi:hypothetical protein